MPLDWDAIAFAAKETGKPILIGLTTDFGRREKAKMSKEAQKRHLNISLGNSKRDPQEKDDELYVMAKL